MTIRVGKPFGPFEATGKGRERREQLDEIGHQIMRQIAELDPRGAPGLLLSRPGYPPGGKGNRDLSLGNQDRNGI